MTMSELDTQPKSPNSIIQQRHRSPSPVIMATGAEDFLPSLGTWSRTLGQKVMVGAAVSVLALGLWPWRETVRASGVIRPAGENTIVQSQLDGALAAVWVKTNQQVRKGEPLAALDRRRLNDERRKLENELRESLAQQRDNYSQKIDLRLQVEATRTLSSAQLRSAARDVDSAAATLRFRETELNRYRSLQASGAVPASVVDEKAAQAELARNELSKARQMLKEQEARGAGELARLRQGSSQTANQNREANKVLEATRSRLAEVQRALANSLITAPTAGTVISSGMRHADQVIRAGERLAEIAPADAKQQVKVRVPSRDIGTIKPSQSAYLRISGCPYPDFGVMRSRVASISADTLRSEQTGLAEYEISLDPEARMMRAGNRSCAIRHGMEVQAEIITRNTTVLGFILTRLRLLSGA
jgi:multidrug efflux pump subunit AcrA (membrane-fusion protein)